MSRRYRRYEWRTARFWRVLLFEPGQGWLRFGTDEREYPEHHGEGLTEWLPCWVAPPARCFVWWLRGWVTIPIVVWRFTREGWGRLSWEEYRGETLRGILRSNHSDDRAAELSSAAVFPRRSYRGRSRFHSQHPGAAK